jgi:hypothetical protein
VVSAIASVLGWRLVARSGQIDGKGGYSDTSVYRLAGLS